MEIVLFTYYKYYSILYLNYCYYVSHSELYLFRVYNIRDVYGNHRQTFMLTKKCNVYCIYIIA